jgi:hypothetical protein
MAEFPLLDLHQGWQDIVESLRYVEELAETLYTESATTWQDMMSVVLAVRAARTALGALPPTLLADIDQCDASLAELEDRADAARS